MKQCSKCNEPKPVSEFYRNKNRPDGFQDACKVCANQMNRASRSSNPDLYRGLHKTQRDKNKAVYLEWKSQQCRRLCSENCVDCLDLHHLDPKEKDVAIANVMHSWSWERLQTELVKCVVVCRNCHAKIHSNLVCLL